MKRMIRAVMLVVALGATAGWSMSITVAPLTGLPGGNPTNTIADAISQINAGFDAANTIVLRSTEGPHILPANTTWAISAGKSVDFVAESGRPIIRLSQSGTTRYMLTISAGTNANNQTEVLRFVGLAFIPPTGLSYANNVADGINAAAGNFVFEDCIFSSNDGSDGIASVDGSVPFAQPPAGNNVGDDWIQFNTYNNATFKNCVLTGANDDAILIGGALSPAIANLTLSQGTVVANNGGAGIQVFGTQTAVVCDGSAGRVLLAKNGMRTGAPDTGIKFFADTDCSLVMVKTDLVDSTHGGIFDFSGVPTITLTDCRLAQSNSGDVATAGNLSVVESDSVPDSGNTVQNITFTRVTVHDTLGVTNPDSLYASESNQNPQQVYTIVDSVFSGAGDSFAEMTNSLALIGPSPPPALSYTAVVTAGPHAIATPGDLGSGQVNADPEYVSLSYTIGRSAENPDFLLPGATAYANASSSGGRLKGGAPGNVAGVGDWMLY